jgi:hypothetical protein
MCKTSGSADVVVAAPGAVLRDVNVSVSEAVIVDPFLNFGDPYLIMAYAGGRVLAASNATPLMGEGKVLVETSPVSFVNTTHGPFPLALAVEKDIKRSTSTTPPSSPTQPYSGTINMPKKYAKGRSR